MDHEKLGAFRLATVTPCFYHRHPPSHTTTHHHPLLPLASLLPCFTHHHPQLHPPPSIVTHRHPQPPPVTHNHPIRTPGKPPLYMTGRRNKKYKRDNDSTGSTLFYFQDQDHQSPLSRVPQSSKTPLDEWNNVEPIESLSCLYFLFLRPVGYNRGFPGVRIGWLWVTVGDDGWWWVKLWVAVGEVREERSKG
ncbi:hypothetical protein L6452_44306 [Arctium lappa]|uniref:Uncharacterized protein n=1 Tax=Arctium lappa TaxID=4217 RepID=A0ACB8XFI7_ARCLA|nr:hypothetical protein L6452_44306 [Arctium lappa]